MFRHFASRALAACVLATSQGTAATTTDPALPTLLQCLERLAQTRHVRIVDKTGRAATRVCRGFQQHSPINEILDRLLQPERLAWRRLDDGTFEIVAIEPAKLDLPALSIEGEPVAESLRPDYPTATPLVEQAFPVTSLGKAWLDTAPIIGFDQIGQYAPNVYGIGQSLAIRGTERDLDYFTSLTITYDGIDLGTRLLDDELVPLNDIASLDLARGPRTFEASVGSGAGAISLRTAAPAAESTVGVAGGLGSQGAWNTAASWSGPIGNTGLAATVAVDRHELPSYVHEIAVPEANVDKRQNDFGRFKLDYTSEAVPGLTAELTALALSGDGSDRWIAAPPPTPGAPPFDLFERNSYASAVAVAHVHARGAASFVRYERPGGLTIDAHVSHTAISRDAVIFGDSPGPAQETIENEIRQRAGITATANPFPDWTVVAGVEHANIDIPSYLPGDIFGHFVTLTDSESIWIEHAWSSSWNTGIGLRFQDERVTDTRVVYANGTSTPTDFTVKYSLPTPLAVVEWHPWPDHTFTLSYGQGYRSGGPYGPGSGPDAFGFGGLKSAERDDSVELAWRARWLDGSLKTTLSAFDGEVRNRFTYYLLDADGNPLGGRVRDRGLEFEANADVSESLRLRCGIGLLSSRYRSSLYLDGQSTAESPPQTATVGVRYGLSQGWYGAADAYHAAAAEYFNSGQPVGRLPSYAVAGFRLGYRSQRSDVALIVTNALDAHYIDRILPGFAGTVLVNEYRLADPRRIELRMSWSW